MTNRKVEHNKRVEIFEEIDRMLSYYCEGCFLHKHNKQSQNKAYAHKFCIKECTVGKRLQEMGSYLTNRTNNKG